MYLTLLRRERYYNFSNWLLNINLGTKCTEHSPGIIGTDINFLRASLSSADSF